MIAVDGEEEFHTYLYSTFYNYTSQNKEVLLVSSVQSSLGGGTGNETNSRREKFQYLLHYTVCMAKSEGDLQEVWKVPLGSNEVKLSEVAIASRTLELSLH